MKKRRFKANKLIKQMMTQQLLRKYNNNCSLTWRKIMMIMKKKKSRSRRRTSRPKRHNKTVQAVTKSKISKMKMLRMPPTQRTHRQR